MRETRQSGSEGGARFNPSSLPYPEQLRSLVADRGGYAPRSRLAGRQNPGGILLPLFISTASAGTLP
jgi:hypothetical protein